MLGGIVLHGPASLTADCSIRDLSDGGARVRLQAPEPISRPAILLIPTHDSAFEAAVAWQDGSELGLTLGRTIDLQSPRSEIEVLARRLWTERRLR